MKTGQVIKKQKRFGAENLFLQKTKKNIFKD